MRDDNLTVVKRGFEAFSRGDLDAFREILAPDCVWHIPGIGAEFRPEYRGPDEVIGFFTTMFETTDGTITDEPEAFFADGDQVVVLERETGTRKGKTLDTHTVDIFRMRDGKVSEATMFMSEPKVWEEFLS